MHSSYDFLSVLIRGAIVHIGFIRGQDVLVMIKRKRIDMTTELFGTEFVTAQAPRFNSAFKGETAQHKDTAGSIIGRRTLRRARRANRAI